LGYNHIRIARSCSFAAGYGFKITISQLYSNACRHKLFPA
jgi:hypothetical protein